MHLQSIPQNPSIYGKYHNLPLAKSLEGTARGGPFVQPGQGQQISGNNRANFISTYYSSQKLNIQYTNSDGDSLSLQFEQIEFQKAALALNGNLSTDEWKEVIGTLKEQLAHLKADMLQKIIEGFSGSTGTSQKQIEAVEIEGLPEYWNAENTAQRIVDFATSFYEIADTQGQQYYEMMRQAITDGFSQAMNILGELPSEISNLSQNTFALAMEKLDMWALEQGIEIGENSQAKEVMA